MFQLRKPTAALAPLRIQAGNLIKTLKGGRDTDEHGRDRFTPPGSIGQLMYEPSSGNWSVHFGDVAIYVAECDLRDQAQYELLGHEEEPLMSAPSFGSQD